MVKISFGGDFCFANDPCTKNIGIVNRYNSLNKSKIVSGLKPLFFESDLSLINLESPISNSFDAANKSAFLMPPEVLDILVESGIGIVNLANNHILQYGEEAFDNTVSLIKSRKIKIIGKSENNLSDEIAWYEIDKLKIAIAGFNERHDFHNNQKYSLLDRKSVLEALRVMEEKDIDVKILVFHWGNEYVNIPSPRQIYDAHFFIDKGANVIIGHHSHVMQPVEKYNGGIIAYSLGNLLFDNLFSSKVKMGLVLNIQFHKNGIDYELIPVWLDELKIIDQSKTEIVKNEYEYIVEKYNKLKKLDSALYNKIYNKELIIERARQRLLMKFHLVKLFFQYSFNEKNQILKNIYEIFRQRNRNEIC